MIHQSAEDVLRHTSTQLWIAAVDTNLVDLLRAGQQAEAALQPCIDDLARWAVRADQGADQDIAVEQNQHTAYA